jgi:sugar phosphate permease
VGVLRVLLVKDFGPLRALAAQFLFFYFLAFLAVINDSLGVSAVLYLSLILLAVQHWVQGPGA